MPRVKASTTTFANRVQFERAVDLIGIKQIKLEKLIADHNAEKAAQDKAHKATVKKLTAELNGLIVQAESFVSHHREEILGDRQSGETRQADFGFRRSPGIVKTLNSKWTFAKAVQALKDAGKKACIKVTESLDKQAVKSQIPEADLSKFGLRLEFPEEFWVEAKRASEIPDKKLKS